MKLTSQHQVLGTVCCSFTANSSIPKADVAKFFAKHMLAALPLCLS
jgi:hypothetical protein